MKPQSKTLNMKAQHKTKVNIKQKEVTTSNENTLPHNQTKPNSTRHTTDLEQKGHDNKNSSDYRQETKTKELTSNTTHEIPNS